jgi:hypothetical protein
MSIKTSECNISNLDGEIRSLINSLLDGKEPLLCYETKESGGIFVGDSSTILILTNSDVIAVYTRNLRLFEAMYLDEVVSIEARLGGENNTIPSIGIWSSGERSIGFQFETKKFLYTFTTKLREAIANAKSSESKNHSKNILQ